jgi:hypothetical protein
MIAQPDAGSIASLLANVAGQSVSEIDQVICKLQEVRDFLQSESDRVRQEVAKFTAASDGTLAFIKNINSALEPWKGASLGQQR